MKVTTTLVIENPWCKRCGLPATMEPAESPKLRGIFGREFVVMLQCPGGHAWEANSEFEGKPEVLLHVDGTVEVKDES